MPKAEIGWTRRDAAGQKLEVYVRRIGAHWRFFLRQKRFDPWQPLPEPPLEDWLALLDAIRRRVARRRARPEEVARIQQLIHQRFPPQGD